jgi:hypothetical protein
MSWHFRDKRGDESAPSDAERLDAERSDSGNGKRVAKTSPVATSC